MFKLFVTIIVGILLLGCSSQKEQALLKSYTEKTQYHKNLQQTESAELKLGIQRMAMLTATYLFRPNFENNDSRAEVFIIGLEFEEDNATMVFDTKSLENNSTQVSEAYHLTLNGKNPMRIQALDSTDKRLKGLSFCHRMGTILSSDFFSC
ncbi:MAG: hypothetical protein Q9M36_08785 [Sulfurovum sp.]|nr:hypothetical protein [Sulfurovum sp.]